MLILEKRDGGDFAGVAFVVKAREKRRDSIRGLDLVYFDGNGELVATDGHRCHKYKMQGELKVGHHMVVTNLRTRIILVQVESPCDPPNYPRVFTKHSKPIEIHDDYHGNIVKIFRAMPKNGANVDYLKDALSGEVTTARCGDGSQPIVLTGPSMSAAIMPMTC